MNDSKLETRKIAILATDGFEQSELQQPREALLRAGAEVDVISLESGTIRGWVDGDWGDEIAVDVSIDEASTWDYDALVLPGGVLNPDRLRRDPRAVAFVREFFEAGKTVGAICHGPWLLVEAGMARGRTLTSFESIRTDLRNAGAQWVDREVVTDSGLVTSRHPGDLPAFNARLIEEIEALAPRGQLRGRVAQRGPRPASVGPQPGTEGKTGRPRLRPERPEHAPGR